MGRGAHRLGNRCWADRKEEGRADRRCPERGAGRECTPPLRTPWSLALLLLSIGASGAQQTTGQGDLEAAVHDLLSRADDPSPEVRAAAAAHLAELGGEAFPALEKNLDPGNQNRSRLCVLALALQASKPGAGSLLARSFPRRLDRDLDLLVPLALAPSEDPVTARILADVALDPRAEPLLRTAAALSLGRNGFGEEIARSSRDLAGEAQPLVAGALALAFGVAGIESSIDILEERLARARERPERSGLYLALSALGRRQVPTASDLSAADPVLPLAAALHYADEPAEEGGGVPSAWTRALESSDPLLRAGLYAALGRGSEPRSVARLVRGAEAEVDSRVRAAIYGAAASRRVLPILRAGRATPGDRAARFAAAATLVLAAPDRGKELEGDLIPSALAALEHLEEPAAGPAALFLAAARVSAAEEPLRKGAAETGETGAAARLALKALRKELDPRALSDAIRRCAFDKGVLFERSLADAVHRFALVALGAASDFLSRRREPGPAPSGAWIAPGRTPPRDAPVYEDLWILLSWRPLDEPFRRGAARH